MVGEKNQNTIRVNSMFIKLAHLEISTMSIKHGKYSKLAMSQSYVSRLTFLRSYAKLEITKASINPEKNGNLLFRYGKEPVREGDRVNNMRMILIGPGTIKNEVFAS